MQKNNRPIHLIALVLSFIVLLWSFNQAGASECIRCHTDKNKLLAITKNLPKKEKSAETSGTG